MILSWPDAWPCEGSFGVDCMKVYKGSHLIYIGECVGNSFFGDFGKTASKAFHTYMDAHFVLEVDILLPVWPGHRDKLTIWKRKEPWTIIFTQIEPSNVDILIQNNKKKLFIWFSILMEYFWKCAEKFIIKPQKWHSVSSFQFILMDTKWF